MAEQTLKDIIVPILDKEAAIQPTNQQMNLTNGYYNPKIGLLQQIVDILNQRITDLTSARNDTNGFGIYGNYKMNGSSEGGKRRSRHHRKHKNLRKTKKQRKYRK